MTHAVQEALSGSGPAAPASELPDAEHMLGLWFRDHAEDRRKPVRALLDGGPTAGRAGQARERASTA
ncbi:hypothetical protein LT493_10875 [Streptomyces tricolor]|nr:hypothetical protein [Streptomyces tricolor]